MFETSLRDAIERGAVAQVAATLACGPANSTASLFTSPASPLDLAGDFQIKGALTQDGINAAVMPPTCDNPVLLIRGVNATTGAVGNWFAAGIPSAVAIAARIAAACGAMRGASARKFAFSINSCKY